MMIREEQLPYLSEMYGLADSEIRIVALDLGIQFGEPPEGTIYKLGSKDRTELPGELLKHCASCGAEVWCSDPPYPGEEIKCFDCVPNIADVAGQLHVRLRELVFNKRLAKAIQKAFGA